MGIGKCNPEGNNKESEETSSPLTFGDPEKAAYNDKPEFPISFTNGVTEKAVCYNKQGILQKLWSIKVRLVPFIIAAIIILAINIAVVAYKSGEKSTTNTEKPVYRYAECEDGWIFSKGKCYYFSDIRDTWNKSQDFCISHKSSLAIIDNKEELNFLNHHKCADNYWIGLSRVNKDSVWVWTNGTPYTETIFKIENSTTDSHILEYAFLNGNVRSEPETDPKKWICNKKLVLPTK